MSILSRTILALGLTALLAGPGLAQQPQRQGRGPGRGGPGGIAGLLTNESVQKELKMDDDQTTKVKDAVQKVQDKYKDDFAKLRDLSGEEQRTKREELSKAVTGEILTALSDILKPEQVTRLKQIELQQDGTRAFTREDVQKALALKDDQKETIKTINDDTAKATREMFQGGQRTPETREKIAALRKEALEKVQGVLTDDQKKTWKDMTGEPFQVVRRRPGNTNQ
jgi:hypothetical protein